MSDNSSLEFEDQNREAMAYNYSIYLMVGLPYLMFGGLGFAVYRHLRQRALLEPALIARLEGRPSPCPSSPGAVL